MSLIQEENNNNSNNNRVAKAGDSFDSMFEWAERAFCPAGMRYYKPEPKADTLDYVFENVESFTCHQDSKEPDVSYNDIGIVRDNSLLEPGPYGQPLHQREQGRKVKPFGERGDVIDYLFENVESYACNEEIPDDRRTMRVVPASADFQHSRGGRGTRSSPQNAYEPEDEIQLYFRPSRGKRKSRKAEF